MGSSGDRVLKQLMVGWIVVISFCLAVVIGPHLVFAPRSGFHVSAGES